MVLSMMGLKRVAARPAGLRRHSHHYPRRGAAGSPRLSSCPGSTLCSCSTKSTPVRLMPASTVSGSAHPVLPWICMAWHDKVAHWLLIMAHRNMILSLRFPPLTPAAGGGWGAAENSSWGAPCESFLFFRCGPGADVPAPRAAPDLRARAPDGGHDLRGAPLPGGVLALRPRAAAARGKTLFHGHRLDVLPYFEQLGCRPPPFAWCAQPWTWPGVCNPWTWPGVCNPGPGLAPGPLPLFIYCGAGFAEAAPPGDGRPPPPRL